MLLAKDKDRQKTPHEEKMDEYMIRFSIFVGITSVVLLFIMWIVEALLNLI